MQTKLQYVLQITLGFLLSAIGISHANSITGQPPPSATTCSGNTIPVAASVSTSCPTGTYRWQYASNASGPWTDFVNNGSWSNGSVQYGNVSGVSGNLTLNTPLSTTLTLSSLSISANGFLVRVKVESGAGCGDATTYSTPTSLGVYAVVSFSSVTILKPDVCPGTNANYTVTLSTTNNPNSTFSWEYSSNNSNWVTAVSGALFSITTTSGPTRTESKLTQLDTWTSAVYYVRAKIDDGCIGEYVTSSMRVTKIDTQVAGPSTTVNRCAGEPINLTIAVTEAFGYPSAIEWQEFNGSTWSAIAGQATTTLSKTVTSAMQGYKFRAKVSNFCEIKYSGESTLSTPASPQYNSHPVDTKFCPGNTRTFSVTAIAGTGSISYGWQLSKDGGMSFSDIVENQNLIFTNTNTATLSVSNIPSNYNGYKVRARILDGCTLAPPIYSTAASLLQFQAPTIPTQLPSTTPACPDLPKILTVGAASETGTVGYRWQISTNAGVSWSYLTNNGSYSGVSTASLQLAMVTPSMNGNRYRAEVYDLCNTSSNTIYSSATTLEIISAPSITTQPSDSKICPGTSTSFTAAATATGTVNYKWEVSIDNGSSWNTVSASSVYSNVTTSTVGLSNVTSGYHNYLYRSSINGSTCPALTSKTIPAKLEVIPAPSISGNPSAASACQNGSAGFSVSGISTIGTVASYQWQYSTNQISWSNVTASIPAAGASGITTGSLALSNIPASIDAHYFRVVVKDNCNQSTSSASAKLSVFTIPTVTSNPVDKSYCEGGAVTLSAAATGYGTINYTWQQSTDGTVFSDLTEPGSFTGTSTATLSIASASGSLSGQFFRVRVTDGCASAFSSRAKLTRYAPPAITLQPTGNEICTNMSTSITMAATPSYGPISYLWELRQEGSNTWSPVPNGTGIYAGLGTSTLAITNAPASINRTQFRVKVSDGCGNINSVISGTAGLNVHDGPVIEGLSEFPLICPLTSTSISVTAVTDVGTVSYQWQVSTDGTTFTNLTDGLNHSNTATSTLSITNTPLAFENRLYRVATKDGCASIIKYSQAKPVKFLPKPEITSQPTSTYSCIDGSASFKVEGVPSKGDLNYQWEVSTNGGALWSMVPGGTSSQLQISQTPSGYNNNRYRVKLADECGVLRQSISTEASLVVTNQVTIQAQPNDVELCTGAVANFTVEATGAGLNYHWQKSIDGMTWAEVVPNDLVSSTPGSISLTPSYSQNGWSYRCLVVGTCDQKTSARATMTVGAKGSFITHPSNIVACQGQSGRLSYVVSETPAATAHWEYSATGTDFSIISATGTSIDVTNVGFYRVRLDNNCGPSWSTIAGLENLPLREVELGANTLVCSEATIVNLNSFVPSDLQGGAFSISGVTISSEFDPSKNAPGVYEINYTPTAEKALAPFCYIATKKILTVSKNNEKPVVTGATDFACPGEKMVVSANSTNEVVWEQDKVKLKEGKTLIYTFEPGKTVSAFSMDQNGCRSERSEVSTRQWSDAFHIAANKEEIVAGEVVAFVVISEVTPIDVNWKFGDGFDAKGKAVSHYFNTPGNYFTTLNVTGLGCDVTVGKNIKVTGEPVTVVTGMENETTMSGITVVNPVQEHLIIFSKESFSGKLTVRDTSGRIIMDQDVTILRGRNELPRDSGTGIRLISIRANSGEKTTGVKVLLE